MYEFTDMMNNRQTPFESPYWFVLERRSVIARSILETDPPHFIEKHDAEVYNQTPDPRPDAVSLPHCLLKPKRSFTIRMLLTGPKGGIKTEGQLVDCDLKEYQRQDTLSASTHDLRWSQAI